MDSTPVSLIRREARAVVTKVIEDNVRGIVQCLPHGDVLELRKLLRTAYPFPERGGWHYKVWCSEVRFALGYQIRKNPRYEKLIKRKPQHVMPAMREWARAQGILDESPESDNGESEGLAGKVILEMRKDGSSYVYVYLQRAMCRAWRTRENKRLRDRNAFLRGFAAAMNRLMPDVFHRPGLILCSKKYVEEVICVGPGWSKTTTLSAPKAKSDRAFSDGLDAGRKAGIRNALRGSDTLNLEG